jgi:bacillithiol biosynthesis deacetylase BshB1
MLDCLIVAPHPDDAELGLGGTIARMIAQGLKIGVLDLTSGEPTPFGTLELRKRETAAASQALGITWRENLGLPNRSLEATLENRALLATVFRRVRPRWIFAPYWTDAHPDHVAATELIEAARFWSKLTKTDMPGEPFHPERVFYYWCVHLRALATPAFVVDISPYWEAKRKSLECYASQFITGREAVKPPFIERLRDQAAYWGWSIGVEYGEPIFMREPLGLRGFGDLV